MTKSQRKGRNAEKELSAMLNTYGYDTHIGAPLNFGSEPDISGLRGVHIEVKHVERLNIYQALEQSIRDSERLKDGTPCVFHRKNRRGWLVTMRLEDWLEMYGKAEE